MKTRSVVLLLVVLAGALLLLAIVIPDFNASDRHPAWELVAIRNILVIQSAQDHYKSQYGKYAAALTELGPPANDLISKSLASGEKNGYTLTLAATPKGYILNARPKVYNVTGRRSFYSDQARHIHQTWSQEPANASSPELK